MDNAAASGTTPRVPAQDTTAGTVHTITAKATDAAGNTGVASAATPITVDLAVPVPPTITGLTAATDTGRSSTDGITGDTTPDLMGTAEKGVTIQIYEGATLRATTTADATTGAWSVTMPALTAGAHAEKKFIQKLPHPDARTFIGKGKLEEIKTYITGRDISVVLFDDDLSASQIANIEKTLGVRTLDRSDLILDIFARRAQTAQAKTQVELAQYQHLLPE